MPGQRLGDPVLDLEPRVHLEEEVPGVRDQELDGADARVADLLRDPDGRVRELGEQAGGEPGRRRLFQHLLVSALHRAVAAAEREHHAVLVGGDLDLDVAAAADLALEEEAPVAEGGLRLGAGRLEGGGQILGPRRPPGCRGRRRPRWPSPPAGSRCARRRAAAWATFSTTPSLQGETGTPEAAAISLAEILSPSRRMASAEGPRKRMPASVDALDEARVLGDEAPAGPDRVRARAPQRRRAARRGRGRPPPLRAGRRASRRRRRGARTACLDLRRCRARSPAARSARACAAPSRRGCSAWRPRRGSRSRAGGSAGRRS